MWFCLICTFCWNVHVCNLFTMSPHSVVYAYHVCRLLHMMKCILNWFLYILYFLLSACFKCGYYGLFVFIASVVQLWIIDVFEINPFLSTKRKKTAGLSVVASIVKEKTCTVRVLCSVQKSYFHFMACWTTSRIFY